jgi:signal transduction histidine kinase
VGEVHAVSVIIRDISERRKLERLQQEFLAMASHELRTPVGVIQGHAQLMQRRSVYREDSVEAIVAQARRLTHLIDDLLLASQIEADGFELHRMEVDLAHVARTTAGHFASGGAHITVRAPDHPVLVAADRHRLEQVLVNLLTNAVKYSPDEAEIEVRVMEDENAVLVQVIDRGMGIPQEDIPHLFDRFYRAHQGTAHVGGAGLGLYISRQIMEAHGGTIGVESEVGRGSTFTLRLPVEMHSEPPAAIAGSRG